jgi:hypothetical protein
MSVARVGAATPEQITSEQPRSIRPEREAYFPAGTLAVEPENAFHVNQARLLAGPLQQSRRIRQFLTTIQVQLNAIGARADCKNALGLNSHHC